MKFKKRFEPEPPPTDPPAPLAKISLEAEVQQVVNWILAGHCMFDVGEAITAKITTDAKKKKQIMDHVLQYFINSGQASPDVIRGWALESLRDLYRRMIEIGDFSNAAKVVKDIVSLQK